MIFSLQEYEDRYKKCQELMKKADVDVLLLTNGSNVFYFSGYRTSLFTSHFRPFIVLIPRTGEPVLIVPNLEWFSAVKETWFEDVRFWGPGGNAADPINSILSVMNDKKLLNSTVAIELDIGQRIGMTYEEYRQMKEALPNCKFVNSTEITWKLRMLKSKEELESMKEASRITSCGYEALLNNAKVGMTERDMQKIVVTEMMNQGCEQEYFISIGAGQERYSFVNPVPTDYALKSEDLVSIDLGAVYNGYWSVLTRVFAVGSISERQRELYEAANKIRLSAIEAVKPGVPIGEVDVAATSKADALGMKDYMLHRSGHTIGLDVHEIPSVSSSDRTIMEPGMCLAIESALHDCPSVGGFRIKNLVAVTETGRDIYDTCTTDLIVISR